jgi:hypothetical protein
MTTEPLNSAQITHRARNVAQVIMGYISTDTDGNEALHRDDLAQAVRECADTGLLPSGADGVLVWETARGLIPASVAVEGLSPEDHPAALRSDSVDIFAGEDFPEPADGEGARVAREEAAWEAQIKAAPAAPAAPASATTQALTEWCRAAEEAAWEAQIKAAPMPAPVPASAPAPAPAPSAWAQRAPVGSVWRFADDGLHAPAGAMGLSVLNTDPRGVFASVREHVAIAAYGEPFVTADCVLLRFPSGPGVVMTVSALLWAAKRVDA